MITMKKAMGWFFAFGLGVLVAVLVPKGVGPVSHKDSPSDEKAKESSGEGEHAAASRVQHGTNGETFLRIDAKTRERMGLQTAGLKVGVTRREGMALGRVLDPGTLASMVSDVEAASAAWEASTRDFERLRILHGQNQNVSARALEAAEASVRKDRIALEASKTKLATTWGLSIAQSTNLVEWVHKLTSQEAALVQVSVAQGDPIPESPVKATLYELGKESKSLTAEWIGTPFVVDPQTQGASYLFLVSSPVPKPGMPIKGWLELPGAEDPGWILPESSVIHHDGETFVYVQRSEELFERLGVQLERAVSEGWIAREGLNASVKLVVTGAQQLLSEESKGSGGEE